MDQKSPDAFRTISEVAEWLETPAHVLRFWESRFPQVKPVKRAGGRRYYRPADMALLGGIKKLLHEDGLTIRGVQKLLRSEGVKHVSALSPSLDEQPPAKKSEDASQPVFKHSAADTEQDMAPEKIEEDINVKPQPLSPAEADREPEFLFETPAPQAAPVPEAVGDLSDIPEPRADDDPAFEGAPTLFPLRNPTQTRAHLAANAAKTAALYERLVTLADNMPVARG